MTLAKRKEWIVEATTGEVLFDSEEDMELYLFTERGYLLFNGKTQIRMYPFVPWPLTEHDRSKLMKLTPCINRQNELMQPDRSDRPMKVEHVADVTGLSISRAYAFVRRLKEAQVIQQDDGVMVVNPLYLNAAGRISKRLHELFREQLEPHLGEWTHKQIRNKW